MIGIKLKPVASRMEHINLGPWWKNHNSGSWHKNVLDSGRYGIGRDNNDLLLFKDSPGAFPLKENALT